MAVPQSRSVVYARPVEPLLQRWGYLGIFVGTFLEGEVVVLLAGALAHQGVLSLWGVILSAFAGSLSGDQLYFLLGRLRGPDLLARHPRLAEPARRARAWLERRGDAFVLSFRFLYGLRTVTPLLLGAAGYPVRRFVALNAAGAAAWAPAIAAVGWAVGEGVRQVIGRAGRIEELAALALGAAAAAFLAWRAWRLRRPPRPRG